MKDFIGNFISNPLDKYDIITNPNMPTLFTCVRRSWKERLFTIPWTPWVSTKIEKNESAILQVGPEKLIMHPHTLQILKDMVEKGESND